MTRLKIIAGCLLVSVLWGGVMLAESVKKFYELQHDLLDKQQRYAEQKKLMTAKSMHLSKSKNELLDSLLDEAQMHDLLVTSVSVAKNQENSMQLKFVLQGNFLQFLIFIESLRQKKMCLQIDAFDMMTEHSTETMKLTLTVLSIQVDHAVPVQRDLATSDPFAADHFTNLLFEHVDAKQAGSIHEMKYVGYLQVGNQQMAMLQLPNGAVQDVTQNELFGVEHARVTHIDESGITLRIGGKNEIKPLA